MKLLYQIMHNGYYKDESGILANSAEDLLSLDRSWLLNVCEHQLPKKVRYLGPLIQQSSRIRRGRPESEHSPLLRILIFAASHPPFYIYLFYSLFIYAHLHL
jgi:hypothetical protein